MTHLEIIEKLIGPINPTGRSEIDAERIANLKAYCDLCEIMVEKVRGIAIHNKDSHESSVQTIGKYADKFIENLKQNI